MSAVCVCVGFVWLVIGWWFGLVFVGFADSVGMCTSCVCYVFWYFGL